MTLHCQYPPASICDRGAKCITALPGVLAFGVFFLSCTGLTFSLRDTLSHLPQLTLFVFVGVWKDFAIDCILTVELYQQITDLPNLTATHKAKNKLDITQQRLNFQQHTNHKLQLEQIEKSQDSRKRKLSEYRLSQMECIKCEQ